MQEVLYQHIVGMEAAVTSMGNLGKMNIRQILLLVFAKLFRACLMLICFILKLYSQILVLSLCIFFSVTFLFVCDILIMVVLSLEEKYDVKL